MANHCRAGIAHNPHELAIIERADRYAAYIFIGRGKKHRIGVRD